MRSPGIATAFFFAAPLLARAAALSPEEIDFFENKIRPVLVAECYECHDAQKHKGGLRVDFRDGLLKGGDNGAAIVPRDPAKSLLLSSIKHLDPDLKMPEKSPKLDDAVIADFEKWIAMGAPDPRDEPPREPVGKPAWEQTLAARKSWWSFQPVKKPRVPDVKNSAWSENAIDRFLLAKIEEHGLVPAHDADPRTLIRRLTFALTGLPPTPEEVENFLSESLRNPQSAIRNAVDRLLASPRFGEHFARHWMDLVRYAESHGSEGDPPIPEAWRYRDYLIRAFNADVPLDQIIRENIAGDLLKNPRIAGGINESALGTAQLRFVEHGFQPVDTRDDQVKAVDNQIDVVCKAFQGLTVSCARCHDHKFDPISQRDYYALFGVFASCRPAQITIDAPEVLQKNRDALAALKAKIKFTLAEEWTRAAENFGGRLKNQNGLARADEDTQNESDALATALKDAKTNPANPLHAWTQLVSMNDADFADAWKKFASGQREEFEKTRAFNSGESFQQAWNLAGHDRVKWFASGVGLSSHASNSGNFSIEPEGEEIIDGIFPAGVSTDSLSTKHNGLLASPRFKITTDSISVRAWGGGGAAVRVIVDNYPLPVNPIFPKAVLDKNEPAWTRLDTAYRKGSWAYIEFGTHDDLTRPLSEKKKSQEGKNAAKETDDGRSWFGAEKIVFHNGKDAPREENAASLALVDFFEKQKSGAPKNANELADLFSKTLADAVAAWREDRLAEPQRALLDFFVRRGLLPATLDKLEGARPLIAEYRRLENEVPVPRRAPGVLEADSYDSPFLPRGDHTQPGDPVPRGYPGVLGGAAFRTKQSGRLELAEAMADEKNPLTARVMANRIWHWLFGRGIVPTVDNFGRLGEKPTHPELLDFLAARLVENHWSLKQTVRFLVTTRAFQMSSEPTARAHEIDPANEWLSHFRVRRMEAESVRDSLLAVSGKLDTTMFGASVGENSPRRSVYLNVKRTNLNPFLAVFDAPKPFTTLGRRDMTNVPAQSLTLLNSKFVIDAAHQWARSLVNETDVDAGTRVRRMFERAFAREPSNDELSKSIAFLNQLARDNQVDAGSLLKSERIWQDFAQSIFNLKEFIYLR